MSQSAVQPKASAHSWWAVWIILLAFILSYADRSIVALLVGPIKRDLVLSDTEISLLTGFAFVICYVGLALPFAAISDRRSRRAIIVWAITTWSAFTAACGFSTTYWQLFLARMGVGAGESLTTPAAYSLVADLFPKEQRGYAYGIFSLANYVGAGLAYVAGGVLLTWFNANRPLIAPFDSFASWQLVFLALAVPGFLVAPLLLTVPEPRMRLQVKPTPSTYKELFAYLRQNAKLFSGLFIAFGLSAMVALSFNAWGPSFFIRRYGLSEQEAGLWLGVISTVFPIAGMLVGGKLLANWTLQGRDDAPLRLILLAMLVMAPVKAISPLLPTWETALAGYSIGLFFGPFTYIGGAAMLPLISPVNLRAQIIALYGFLISIIGMTMGPFVVALFTDYLFRDEAQVGYSLSLTVTLAGPVMCILIAFQFKRFRQVVRLLEGREKGD